MSDVNFTPVAVTYARAAAMTGWSKRTIQYAVSNGLLEASGRGKKKVIPLDALHEWVKAGCPTTFSGRAAS